MERKKMTQQNLITLNIPQNDIAEINKAIATLKTKLIPQLKAIKSEDRKELPKMGDKTVAFVSKALEHCTANPELAPQFLDVNEFKNDVHAVETLRSIYSPLEQIAEMLSDSMTLAGSDAYAAALMFYGSVKSAKKSNVAKAAPIYDDLANRFPAKRGDKAVKQG
jgi:methyl coenzyme M reductase subunit C-like uncharacterized protein (methanogenesis marker protein 7)